MEIKLKEQPDIFHWRVKFKLWSRSILVAVVFYAVMLIFSFGVDKVWSFLTFSKALAAAAALLLAASFALSGFCYYFDFLDTKLGYRKYLGLLGYFLALLYSFSLLITEPDRYLFGFGDNFWSGDFLLGIGAMVYFTFMALISNGRIMKWLGVGNWRLAMRGGYIAWALLGLRAYILEKDQWWLWVQELAGWPPPRMMLSLLIVAVILFRISIEVVKRVKKHYIIPVPPVSN